MFKDRHPSTVAMTVLVVVEMFNALNALSENNSLLQVRRPCLGHIFKQHAHNLTELLSNPSVAAVLCARADAETSVCMHQEVADQRLAFGIL